MFKTRMIWVLSFLLAAGIIVIINFREDEVKIRPSYQTSSMAELHLTHRDGNAVKWELAAAKAIIPEEKKKIHLESLSLRINRSPQIFLTSSSGTYEIEKGDFTLDEPVELDIEESKFITSTLTWNSNSEIITTDAPVQFKGRNFLIEGTGLRAGIKQKNVTVTKDVKAIFYH